MPYGSETWRTTEAIIKKKFSLSSTDVLKILLYDKIENTKLKEMGAQRNIEVKI